MAKAQRNGQWLAVGDAYGATLGRMKGPSGGRRAWHGHFDDVGLSHLRVPSGRDKVPRSLNSSNSLSMGTLLACCGSRQASFDYPVNDFTRQGYLRAHPGPFGNSFDNCRNLPKLSDFAAERGSLGQYISRSPTHILS